MLCNASPVRCVPFVIDAGIKARCTRITGMAGVGEKQFVLLEQRGVGCIRSARLDRLNWRTSCQFQRNFGTSWIMCNLRYSACVEV